MTEREFAVLIEKNPHLRVRTSLNGKAVSASELLKGSPREAAPKYRNIRLYQYEDGLVNEKSDLTGHGKITDVFDSTKEYIRWTELQLLQKAGKIRDLKRQEIFCIQEAFTYKGKRERAIDYKADFTYKRCDADEIVVEDVKAFDSNDQRYRSTKDFNLKWKLLKAKYPQHSFEIF